LDWLNGSNFKDLKNNIYTFSVGTLEFGFNSTTSMEH
jgi:hypothetical protein